MQLKWDHKKQSFLSTLLKNFFCQSSKSNRLKEHLLKQIQQYIQYTYYVHLWFTVTSASAVTDSVFMRIFRFQHVDLYSSLTQELINTRVTYVLYVFTSTSINLNVLRYTNLCSPLAWRRSLILVFVQRLTGCRDLSLRCLPYWATPYPSSSLYCIWGTICMSSLTLTS